MAGTPSSSRSAASSFSSSTELLGYAGPFSQNDIGTTNAFAVRVWLAFPATFGSYLFAVGTAGGNMDLGIYTDAGVAVSREGSFAMPAAGRRTRAITGGPLALAAGEYALTVSKNSAASIGLLHATLAVGVGLTVASAFPLPNSLAFAESGTAPFICLVP